MKQEPIITFEQVSFGYENDLGQKVPVITDLSLQIPRGAFVTVIGPNGSGKSTMAKLMNALLLPDSGRVTVAGWETWNPETIMQIRRTVGMVFQNPDNQIVGTTVEDDVAFGLENMGMEPAEMRQCIDLALRAVQMDTHLKQQPHRLSGGQKQRVAIAGIIAMKPAVIILDEATAMLDPQGRQEVLSLVHRLNREEGMTIINITHFPEEALDSDWVVVMRQGSLMLQGTPRDVFAQMERLQDAGLDVPYTVRLRDRLQARGIQLPPLLHREELVEELCKLFLKT